MRKSLLILLGISCLTLAACNGIKDNHSITLNKNTLELEVNEVETLIATIEPNDIENPHLIWVVDDSSIVTVNNGAVTALAEGTTNVSVYLNLNNNMFTDPGEPFDVCTVIVLEPVIDPVPVNSVTLSQTSLNIGINEEIALTATVLPGNATEKTITWVSNNTTVATVTNGNITAINAGSATITAYVDENLNSQRDTNEKYATCSVTVSGTTPSPTVWVTSVNINSTSLSIEEDSFDMVYATVLPSNATYKTVTWLSSNTSVATVSNGRITGVNAGNAVVTAYVDENGNASLDNDEQNDTVNITITEKTVDPNPSEDPIPSRGESLPIGNTSVSGPNNTTPADITNWVNYDFFSSLPPYWSFIMGNNKKATSSDFYAESSGGGFKFSQVNYGLQSPLLNSWLKTEVRLTVSQVHGNSQNANQYKDKPIFHIYSYDSEGYYLGMQTYEQQSSFANVTEIKFYIANPEMAYFEIRLNAFPYKSSQCYNFGVSQISIKGWPYGL